MRSPRHRLHRCCSLGPSGHREESVIAGLRVAYQLLGFEQLKLLGMGVLIIAVALLAYAWEAPRRTRHRRRQAMLGTRRAVGLALAWSTAQRLITLARRRLIGQSIDSTAVSPLIDGPMATQQLAVTSLCDVSGRITPSGSWEWCVRKQDGEIWPTVQDPNYLTSQLTNSRSVDRRVCRCTTSPGRRHPPIASSRVLIGRRSSRPYSPRSSLPSACSTRRRRQLTAASAVFAAPLAFHLPTY